MRRDGGGRERGAGPPPDRERGDGAVPGAFRTPKGAVGLGLLLLLCAAALLAPVIFPGGVDQQTRDSFLKPSMAHPFGTDELGRDIFVRSIYAMRISVGLVMVAVPFAMALGTLMGLAGAVSRWLGEVSSGSSTSFWGSPAWSWASASCDRRGRVAVAGDRHRAVLAAAFGRLAAGRC